MPTTTIEAITAPVTPTSQMMADKCDEKVDQWIGWIVQTHTPSVSQALKLKGLSLRPLDYDLCHWPLEHSKHVRPVISLY